jgi:hypothetical protein
VKLMPVTGPEALSLYLASFGDNDPVYAGHAFVLELEELASGQPVLFFARPVGVCVQYEDADWQRLGVDEHSLRLHNWNGGRWVPQWPCGECYNDCAANTLHVQVSHAGRYAVFGTKGWWSTFLPWSERALR